MRFLIAFLMLIGRIAISVIFILAGAGKFMDPSGTAAYMASKGMSMIPFFLYAAATLEILGGLSLFLGWKARWGGALLALFLIPVTLIFHSFWTVDASEKMLQQLFFLKNLAIFGGLLYAVANGPGRISIDRE
jgi:putative oxidoreductase